MITDPLFYLVAVPAVVIMGLSKGGLAGVGVLALPLMTLAVSPVQGAAIMLPILIVQDIVGVWAFRKTIDRRNLYILLPSAAFGVAIGYLLAAQMPDAIIAMVVGIISIVFGARRFYLDTRLTPPPARSADVLPGLFWGACCGFTSMISHSGAPPFQVYVLPQKLPRDIFIGTSAVVFAVINWMKVVPYFALGQFTRDNLTTAAILFPLAFASTWAGVFLVRRIGGKTFYLVVYALLILLGIKLIYSALQSLGVFVWP